MTRLDLAIVKISPPDSYCGQDYLCIDGGTQLLSLILWVVILVSTGVLGAYLMIERGGPK